MAARSLRGTNLNGWDQKVRGRIQASMLINRLQNHVRGKIEMQTTQVAAALGLLRKCVPDLAMVEHKGEVAISYVAEMPAPMQDVNAWQNRYAKPETALQ